MQASTPSPPQLSTPQSPHAATHKTVTHSATHSHHAQHKSSSKGAVGAMLGGAAALLVAGALAMWLRSARTVPGCRVSARVVASRDYPAINAKRGHTLLFRGEIAKAADSDLAARPPLVDVRWDSVRDASVEGSADYKRADAEEGWARDYLGSPGSSPSFLADDVPAHWDVATLAVSPKLL